MEKREWRGEKEGIRRQDLRRREKGVDRRVEKMVWHVSEQRDQENKKRKPNVEYSEHLLLSPARFTRDKVSL